MAVVIGLSLLGVTSSLWAGQGELYGTLAGAGFGGLIGNQIGHGPGRVATTTAGVFAGGLIGNNIGHSMDQTVRPFYSTYAAPYYANPGSIAFSSYVPNYVAPPEPPPIYIDADYGSYCREYSQTVRIGDQIQESYGTACLQPDGSWKAVH